MCPYATRPYTTGTTSYNIFLQTPIRDRVACPSGPAESYVVPIANGSAYLDVSALSLQLIVLLALLVGPSILYVQKKSSKKFLLLASSLGILYGAFLLLATVNHTGRELVLPIIALSTVILSLTGLFIIHQKS